MEKKLLKDDFQSTKRLKVILTSCKIFVGQRQVCDYVDPIGDIENTDVKSKQLLSAR